MALGGGHRNLRAHGRTTNVVTAIQTLGIAAVDATVDEGVDAEWTVTLTRNGLAVPVSVTLQEMTAAELGITEPELAKPEDFASVFSDDLFDAATADGHVSATQIGGLDAYILSFDPAFTGSFTITRPTNNNPTTGTKVFGLKLLDATANAVITSPNASISIADTAPGNAAPVNTVLPALSGSGAVDEQVVSTFGTFSGVPAPSVTGKWRRKAATKSLDSTTFGDVFTGAGNLTARAGWSLISGTASDLVTTSGGELGTGITSPGASLAYCTNQSDADHSVQFILRSTTGSTGQVVFRGDDGGLNYLQLGRATSAWNLQKVIAGAAAVTVATSAVTGSIGDTIRITAIGNAITVYRNGTSIITYTLSGAEITSLAANTRAGFRNGAVAAAARFDNFYHAVLASEIDISGATGAAYIPVAADLAAGQVYFRATATNPSGSVSADSPAKTVTAAASTVAPSFGSSLPIITGAAQVGQVLTVTDASATGSPTPAVTRQWQKATTNISGATGSTYTVLIGDVGSTIRCINTAANGIGSNATATSANTAVVVNAPSGAITDVTLSSDFVYLNSAADTVVGTFVGVGGTIATGSLTGNAGGRFKIVTNTSLKCDAVAADFEGPPQAFATNQTLSIPFYTVTGTFTGAGGGTVTKQFTIRPKFTKINPSVAGFTNTDVTSFATWNTAVQNTASNQKVTASAGWIGVNESNQAGYYKVTGASGPFSGRTGLHIRMHRRVLGMPKDQAMQFENPSSNIVIEDASFLPGGDRVGTAPTDRDGVIIRSGHDYVFRQCLFGWTGDENASVIGAATWTGLATGLGYPRRVRYTFCAFIPGLAETADAASKTNPNSGTWAWRADGEPGHPYGTIVYNNCMNVVYDKCLMIVRWQRGPVAHYNRGILIVNNVIMVSGGSFGGQFAPSGTQIDNPDVGKTNKNHAFRIEANLYYPVNYNAQGKKQCIVINNIGAGAYIYLPEGTDHDNHYFNPRGGPTPVAGFGSPNLAAQPIPRSGVGLYAGSDPSVLINYRPFETDMDDERLPTGTLAERTTLYTTVVGLAGPRARDGSDNPIAGINSTNMPLANAINKMITVGDIDYNTRPEQVHLLYDTSIPDFTL